MIIPNSKKWCHPNLMDTLGMMIRFDRCIIFADICCLWSIPGSFLRRIVFVENKVIWIREGLKKVFFLHGFWNKAFFRPTYFIKKFILTNRSCVNDLPILTQKQPKLANFDKTDFLGLKFPPEMRVEPKTCMPPPS